MDFPSGQPFLAGAVTALVALFIGSATLGIRGIYFTITTFAFTEVLRGIYAAYPNPFGGPGGIHNIPFPPGIKTKVQFYYFAVIFVLISFFVFYRLARGRIGMICDGLKLNELLEECLGIDTRVVRVVVFVVGSTFAGFVGSIMAYYLRHVNPETFATPMSIDVLVFSAVGGFGSIFGAVIGATSLTLIGELLYGVGAYKSLIFGTMLIVIVLFLPNGIIGFVRQIYVGLTKKEGG